MINFKEKMFCGFCLSPNTKLRGCSSGGFESTFKHDHFFFSLFLFMHLFLTSPSLAGSPSGSADTPPAAAAAVSTKHWSQVPETRRQAAEPTGTVNILLFSESLLDGNLRLSDGSAIWLCGRYYKK